MRKWGDKFSYVHQTVSVEHIIIPQVLHIIHAYNTSGQNNLTQGWLHHCHRWTVQSYSSGGANTLVPPGYSGRFCIDDGRVSLYFTMGRPFPSKLPFLPTGIWTPI